MNTNEQIDNASDDDTLVIDEQYINQRLVEVQVNKIHQDVSDLSVETLKNLVHETWSDTSNKETNSANLLKVSINNFFDGDESQLQRLVLNIFIDMGIYGREAAEKFRNDTENGLELFVENIYKVKLQRKKLYAVREVNSIFSQISSKVEQDKFSRHQMLFKDESTARRKAFNDDVKRGLKKKKDLIIKTYTTMYQKEETWHCIEAARNKLRDSLPAFSNSAYVSKKRPFDSEVFEDSKFFRSTVWEVKRDLLDASLQQDVNNIDSINSLEELKLQENTYEQQFIAQKRRCSERIVELSAKIHMNDKIPLLEKILQNIVTHATKFKQIFVDADKVSEEIKIALAKAKTLSPPNNQSINNVITEAIFSAIEDSEKRARETFQHFIELKSAASNIQSRMTVCQKEFDACRNGSSVDCQKDMNTLQDFYSKAIQLEEEASDIVKNGNEKLTEIKTCVDTISNNVVKFVDACAKNEAQRHNEWLKKMKNANNLAANNNFQLAPRSQINKMKGYAMLVRVGDSFSARKFEDSGIFAYRVYSRNLVKANDEFCLSGEIVITKDDGIMPLEFNCVTDTVPPIEIDKGTYLKSKRTSFPAYLDPIDASLPNGNQLAYARQSFFPDKSHNVVVTKDGVFRCVADILSHSEVVLKAEYDGELSSEFVDYLKGRILADLLRLLQKLSFEVAFNGNEHSNTLMERFLEDLKSRNSFRGFDNGLDDAKWNKSDETIIGRMLVGLVDGDEEFIASNIMAGYKLGDLWSFRDIGFPRCLMMFTAMQYFYSYKNNLNRDHCFEFQKINFEYKFKDIVKGDSFCIHNLAEHYYGHDEIMFQSKLISHRTATDSALSPPSRRNKHLTLGSSSSAATVLISPTTVTVGSPDNFKPISILKKTIATRPVYVPSSINVASDSQNDARLACTIKYRFGYKPLYVSCKRNHCSGNFCKHNGSASCKHCSNINGLELDLKFCKDCMSNHAEHLNILYVMPWKLILDRCGTLNTYLLQAFHQKTNAEIAAHLEVTALSPETFFGRELSSSEMEILLEKLMGLNKAN